MGSIDQGETLYRGELRLTLAKDCHGGQALPVGDHPGTARGLHDRLVMIAERRSRQFQRARQVQLIGVRSSWTLKIRDIDDHSWSARATNRARQGVSRSTTLGDSSPSRTRVPPSSSTTSP
jgi:hypothetical protein